MRHLSRLSAVLCIAGWVLPGSPLAAAGPVFEPGTDGRPTLEFAEPRIYDLTENYDGNASGIDLSYTLVQDPNGRLTGFGTGDASALGIDISLQFRIDGSVKGSGKVTRVRFKMTGDGEATNGIQTIDFTFTAQVKAEITSGDFPTILGSIVVQVCIEGGRCEGKRTPGGRR